MERIRTVQVVLMGYCLKNCGANVQLIGFTVSDAIDSNWLWSTATGSCPLGFFSSIADSSW